MPVSKKGNLYYTAEQYAIAKEASALEYAKAAGYDLLQEGSTHYLREHDSMVFTLAGRWFWNSRQLSGRAIEFIMHYEGRSLAEAVNLLAGDNPTPSSPSKYASPPQPTPPPKPFQLPERADNMRRLFAYLCKTRCIDQAIVEYLVHEKRLYEGVNRKRSEDGQMMEFHNAVFLGLDETGQPRNAFQRGLSTAASYKGEVEGGQKEFPFHIPGRLDSETVFVFEAAIDAMSHATLYKQLGKDWMAADRIALGGIAAEPLLHFLKHHPAIRNIGLALDTDLPGQAGVKQLTRCLKEKGYSSEQGYNVFREASPKEKDWNDYLRLRNEKV